MRVLLDTNIIIHRETKKIINQDIGKLFNWLDRLKYQKIIHPFTIKEINQYKDEEIVKSFNIKLDSYNRLQTIAKDTSEIEKLRQNDKTNNDFIDTSLLNELANQRVDILVTEDRGIHRKAEYLNLSDRVFTIDSFLEKVYVENPDLVDYNVLSVKKEFFGNISIENDFFNSLKKDYPEFETWFNKKADEVAYVCYENDKIVAFLYLKVENQHENYSDIEPLFIPKKRLKIGTFKVASNGFKLGERFLKIIFDNGLRYKVDEIYVTIFDKDENQRRLIGLLMDWGFYKHGIKTHNDTNELVFVKDFHPILDINNPKNTYPFVDRKRRYFIVPIYPKYHTELFPDSILRNESPTDFIENQPHRNAIQKVYISRSFYRDLNPGDIILFYRTGGYYKSVITTIGIVDDVIQHISDENEFIRLCRKRSVFNDEELKSHWNYNLNNRPFIVNFLYLYSFPRRLNMQRLIELGIIRDSSSAPRGFEQISKEQFEIIMKESQANESFIIN